MADEHSRVSVIQKGMHGQLRHYALESSEMTAFVVAL